MYIRSFFAYFPVCTGIYFYSPPPNRSTFTCPLCPQSHMDCKELVDHVNHHHANSTQSVVSTKYYNYASRRSRRRDTVKLTSLAPDHSLARDLTCARERVWHLESLFLVQMSKFDISNQIRKNAIKLSHDSTSQRRLIVLDLCHF